MIADVEQWNDVQMYRHNSSLSEDGDERGDADARRTRRRRSLTDQLPDGSGDLKISGQTSVTSLRPLQSGKLSRQKMTSDQLMAQKQLKQLVMIVCLLFTTKLCGMTKKTLNTIEFNISGSQKKRRV